VLVPLEEEVWVIEIERWWDRSLARRPEKVDLYYWRFRIEIGIVIDDWCVCGTRWFRFRSQRNLTVSFLSSSSEISRTGGNLASPSFGEAFRMKTQDRNEIYYNFMGSNKNRLPQLLFDSIKPHHGKHLL